MRDWWPENIWCWFFYMFGQLLPSFYRVMQMLNTYVNTLFNYKNYSSISLETRTVSKLTPSKRARSRSAFQHGYYELISVSAYKKLNEAVLAWRFLMVNVRFWILSLWSPRWSRPDNPRHSSTVWPGGSIVMPVLVLVLLLLVAWVPSYPLAIRSVFQVRRQILTIQGFSSSPL